MGFIVLPQLSGAESGMLVVETIAKIRKAMEALPGVKPWEPKEGKYLCAGAIHLNKNNTFYVMEKEIDWNALTKFVYGYKKRGQPFVMIIGSKTGRSIRNK